MRKKITTKKDNSSLGIILFGVCVVTLYFNTQSTDPFNAPKLWVLLLLTSILLGDLLFKIKRVYNLVFKLREVQFLTLFVLSLLISFIFSEEKYTAFFGDFQRKNGLLQYLCMFIIFISTVISVKESDKSKIYLTGLFLGTVSVTYGTMQHYGHDFVLWNNPYNAVIITVGNPNFAAALMAILAVINFSGAFDQANSILLRVLNFSTAILLFVVIFYSDARQGLLAGALGLMCFIIITTHRRNKLAGKVLLMGGIVLVLLSILGMLQKGPLSELLYKGSVSIRGFYWRAALKMFFEHPIFGVGLDSYGLFFKEVREVQYPLRYGYSITSSNAHNTFLQFFATGGFFVGIFYFLFIVSILYSVYRTIPKIESEDLVFYSGLVGAWLAFQSQSLISIDNIGISIWNWVLSGILVGLNFGYNKSNSIHSFIKTSSRNPQNLLITWILFLTTFVFVSVLYRGENLYLQLRNGMSNISSSKSTTEEFVSKIYDTPFIDPQYKLLSLQYLEGTKNYTLIEEKLNILITESPRNLDYLSTLANFYSNIGNHQSEIQIRLKIRKLDPWNAQNLLDLGIAYRSTANYSEMNKIKIAILSFAGQDPVSEKAKSELQPQ